MKPKSRAKMVRVVLSTTLLAALLCSARQVNSWQMLEPGQQQQSQPQLVQVASSTFADSPPKIIPNLNEIPQEQQQQQAPTSTAGKIIDTVGAAAVTALKEATLSSLGAKSAPNQHHQLMKPSRKSSELATKEQEIYRLHETVHQYIAPARKSPSSASSSSSSFVAESDGRDSSALSSIFDNLRSGITSRSSIVKAISDNKLSRTLTDVGKTIGSNKYVAGAAAASALAALGLAVSKFITPYMFAGSFAGSEPLMTSGSSAAEQYVNPSRLSYGDVFSGATSLSPMDYSTPSFGGAGFSSYPPNFSQDPSRATYMDTAGSVSQPTYYQPGVYMPVAGQDGKQLFITYTPSKQQTSPYSPIPNQYQQQQQQQQTTRQHQTQSHDVNGHYTQYYDQNPPIENSYTSSQYSQPNYNIDQQQQQATVSYQQRPVEYVYSSSSSQPQQQAAGGDMMSSGDQIASASVGVATYAAQQPANQLQARASPTRSPVLHSSLSNGRRYGAVPLKLKGSDRARVIKASKEVEYARQLYVKAADAGDKSFTTPPASLLSGSVGPADSSAQNRYVQQQQQQQQSTTNPIMFSANNKDQGQATPQANSNSSPAAPYRTMKLSTQSPPIQQQQQQQTRQQTAPEVTTNDRPAEKRRRSSSSPWISMQQSTDHQGTSTTGDDSKERVFVVRGLDYQQESDASNREQSANDVVGQQQIDAAANTKSGTKLTATAGQPFGQQQLESFTSVGGLSVLSAPKQLRPPSDNAGDNQTTPVAAAAAAAADESDSGGNGEESNNDQTQRQRGQSAASSSSSQGKSDSQEDS